MSVIIRLQNLPWSANALDIRQFFQGLAIPEGGVHIVGGENGDAFIAFSTDEDARQAMMHTGGKIKEVQVSLLLSSRTEMQKVIDTARQKVLGIQAASLIAPAQPVAPVQQPIQQPVVQQPVVNQPPAAVVPNIPIVSSPQMTMPMQSMPSQLSIQQRLLGMVGMGMAQLNNLPMGNTPQNNQQIMHPHMMSAHQPPPHFPHQQPPPHHALPTQQPNNPMMAQQHHNPLMVQQHPSLPNQPLLQNQPNKPIERRTSRDARGEKKRSRSRSRDRKRSRDRRDRSGGSSRRRRSRSRSRDRNRRRDRSRSREKSKDRGSNRESRDRRREERSKGGKEEKSRGKDEPANNVAKNNQQAPTPWATPNVGGAAPGMPMNMPRFPFPQNMQGDMGVWGQQNNFNPQQAQMQQQMAFPQNGGPPMNQQRRQNSCVEMSNMSSMAGYRDIRDFFQNLHVVNIKLVCDEKGQKVGKAFVKFGTPECKVAAVKMNGTMFKGTQRVEVKPCSEKDYDRALDSFSPNQEPAVVAITNIPPYANEVDVKRVFHGARIFNVVLMHPGDDTAIPSAFVQFSTQNEKSRAVAASGKLKIDGKEIYVTESSFEDIFRAQKAVQNQVVASKSDTTPATPSPQKELVIPPGPVVSECILLQDLPTSVNNREILDFFSDVGLIPLHIYIMQDDKGAPVGDAFCEFRNPAEGARAVGKNKSTLGSKEVSVRPVARQEMEMALGFAKNPSQMMPRNGQEHMRPPMRPNFMGRPPFDPRNPQMFGPRGPFQRPPFPPHMMGMRQRPPFNMSGPLPPQQQEPEFGKPGCVVEVTNVPFQADIDEILSFFADFDLTRQDIIRRYNDNGKPTGDLRISFHTPQDAQRALMLKFKKMRDRQIFINLLQA
ncbi:RNA-binding protein 12 [Neocloeon triangulifer]|uniref:RNA-binding protein 12 n=1 Tax=Neocloeon triangulifer TaxID=2078957 RepID=UPI00286EE690|nr:RNA-binding protein 12 [Neocloeon triangulifer]